MRISLIYGEDTAKAYGRYRELIDASRSKGFEIIQITDPKNVTSQSLFDDKVVFTLDKPKKVKPNDWKWLSKNAEKYNSNLLIYYEGNAPVTITKNLPKEAKKEKFELPRIIFTFLDSFYPGNSKQSLKLLNDLVQNEPIELVFHLLSRHLRDLYWVSEAKESMEIPDWRKSKLAGQAKKFSISDLQFMIKELAEMDVRTKTSDENLRDSLDILILKRLK